MASLLDIELGNGPAQTDPNAVRRLAKQTGLLGLSFAPGAGITDYAGKFPAVDGGFEPSAVDNWRLGNYGTSLLQGLGAFGDSLSVLGPAGMAVGGVVKAPRALQKAGGLFGDVTTFPRSMENTNKAIRNDGDVAGGTSRDYLARVEAAKEAKRKGEITSIPDAVRLSPREVKQRQELVDSVLRTKPDVWRPPSYGLYDRSVMDSIPSRGGVPGVEQVDLPRYAPPRADVSYLDEVMTPANERRAAQMVERGLLATDEGFYKSYQPLRAAFREYGYTDKDFIDALAATSFSSARNTVANENAGGALLQQMKRKGIPINAETLAAERELYSDRMGTGLTIMEGHALPFARYLEEGLPTGFKNSQKISSFLQNKIGNFRPYTLDTHEVAGLSYATPHGPYFWAQGGAGDTEYGALEAFAKKVADRVGVDPAVAQEGRWFGLGELTGLKTGGGDFLDNFEKQVAYTAHNRGLPMDRESLRKYGVKSLAGEQGYDLLPYMKKDPMPDYRPKAR
jgi:hypothetical protein